MAGYKTGTDIERLELTGVSDRYSFTNMFAGRVVLHNVSQLRPDDYEEWAPRITPPTILGGPDALPEPVAAEAQRGIKDIQTWLGEKTLELAAA